MWPSVPRLIRVPRRFQESATAASVAVQQDTPDVYYSEIYLEVISILVTSLDSRFETDAKTMLEAVENFILHNDEEALNRICEFYGRDLDRSRLSLHRQMFFDIIRHKSQNVHTFETVLLMFCNDSKFGDMLSELHKLLRIVLTVPITTCTAELSFSALRRWKKFLAYPSGKTSSCRKGNCHWVSCGVSCGVLRCPAVFRHTPDTCFTVTRLVRKQDRSLLACLLLFALRHCGICFICALLCIVQILRHMEQLHCVHKKTKPKNC